MLKNYLISTLILSALSFNAFALEKEGKATLPIKGTLLSTVTDSERVTARKAALIDAWKNYVNDASINSISRVSTLEKNKSEIDQKLSKCVGTKRL